MFWVHFFQFDGATTNTYYQMMAEIETALDEVLPVQTNSMFNGLDSSK